MVDASMAGRREFEMEAEQSIEAYIESSLSVGTHIESPYSTYTQQGPGRSWT